MILRIMKNKKWVILFIVAILLFGVLFTISDHIFGKGNEPLAVKGVLDLRKASFGDPVFLNGEWALYFHQLLDPKSIQTTEEKPRYRTAPDRWGQDLNPDPKQAYYGTGYGTYHLVIKVPSHDEPLGIYISSMCTAYKLYINGELAATNGIVGTTKDTSVPFLRPTVIPATPIDGEIELVLQISNYHYCRGGIWAPIRLGHIGDIQKIHEYKLLYSAMVCTAVLVIGFLSFLLPLLSAATKRIYLALFASSILSVFVIATTNNMLFYYLFPRLPFRVGVMSLYIALIWFPSIAYLSIMQLFHSKIGVYNYIIFAIDILLTIPVLVCPLEVFTYLSTVIIIAGIPSLFGILYEIGRSFKRNHWESYYLLFSLLVIAPSIFLSNIYHACIIQSLHFDAFPVGLLTFIIIQAVIMCSRYERMNRETHKSLALANDREIARLNAQIRPHFLYNALNSIILQCYKNPKQAATLLENLSVFLRNRFRFSEQRQFISLDEELDGIKAYLTIESARFHKDININIHNDLEESFDIPALLLQPLVENALLHGIKDKDNGQICIRIAKEKKIYLITVCDNGKGMSQSKIKSVLTGKTVGALYNINQRLVLLYNRPLEIRSSKEGTCFSVKIPTNRIQ